ncbi:MAG TPA: GerMN domain-containing protein [Herpetosiphonaceae bacterium]
MNTRYRSFRVLIAGIIAAAFLPLAATPLAARPTADVAEPFRDYYNRHQGIRVLGYPLTDLVEVDGYAAQYFEKGRIEDHRWETTDPNWAFLYGRLTADLMERAPNSSANTTNMTYGDLRRANDPRLRHAPPAGFKGGVASVHDGMFVPYDSQLRAAPGYHVAPYFWAYINRSDLFPGGWLHDIGLPMTDPFTAETVKQGQRRTIFMQAFERTVLSYDMRNPAGWQVERGNIGTDMVRTLTTFGAVEVPTTGARATLPLHMLIRGGQPNERVTATLRWRDGTELSQAYTLLRGEDGRGLLIDSLNWMGSGPPPQPRTQTATLEIRSQTGDLLARQTLTILSASDPDTQVIDLYWVLGDNLQAMPRRIPKTVRVGSAALEELLWGPGPPNFAGFETGLPTPRQVLTYPGRTSSWGPRVTLRKLTIVDGVATADFSREMAAYGGGSTRVMFIRQQITRTLMQFPSVREVRIAIEGQTEAVLEP